MGAVYRPKGPQGRTAAAAYTAKPSSADALRPAPEGVHKNAKGPPRGGRAFCISLVEPRGIEPLTSSLRTTRSPI
jgi:hypothetical protein